MYSRYFKRGLDFSVSLVLLLLFMPLFLCAMLLVIVGDGFPVFYLQDRIGKDGKTFRVYKLRTMKSNTESMGSTSMKDDPRYFWGSRFLRSYKLDELPQLLNIIKGDMSLVGPRPTVEEDYLRMDERQRQRFHVRPGLTGLAQVSGNTSLLWPQRIELDIRYCKQMSFWNDMLILAKTVLMWVANKLDTDPPSTGEW